MNKCCTINITIPRVIAGPVDVYEWTSSDPFPHLGSAVGVDTETELITDSCLYPALVVLGVYDGDSKSCYIVTHEHAAAFMKELSARDIQQRYFNLGFDEGVLDNEDEDKSLMEAIDSGRVVDMQIRAHLHQITEDGFVLQMTHSLAGCCAKYLGIHLDKGDGTENSARLSFHRGVPLTDEQKRYLPMDCITTWALGEVIPSQKVEVAHTKGMCVLSHISANGFMVDPDVFRHFEQKLLAQRAEQRDKLVLYGFPDPDGKQLDTVQVAETFKSALMRFSGCSKDREVTMPGKAQLRLMLVYMLNHSNEPSETAAMRTEVLALTYSSRSMGVVETRLYKELSDTPVAAFDDNARKRVVFPLFVAYVMDELANQYESGLENGYDVLKAIEAAADRMDQHKELALTYVHKGPKQFFQEHVVALIKEEFPGGRMAADAWLDGWKKDNPGKNDSEQLKALMSQSKLKLATTKKSGDIQLTLKDKWRLDDCGVHDGFLDAYTTFGHCQKYLSTYLNEDYIKSDGRVHPRFVSILRTGRTSCTNPNIQNLPSRDKAYPLKLMYQAEPGYILCSTDFSFIELCAFAQNAYDRYRDRKDMRDVEGSVMRKVINAGLDPHRWFSGVMYKVISPDLSHADDPQWVADTKAFLKANISDAQRQSAKMAKPKLALQRAIAVE